MYPVMNSRNHDGATEVIRIMEGAEYIYTCIWPKNCYGHRYRVVAVNAVLVPAYQHIIIVRCLTGANAGQWVATTEANFAMRYVPVELEKVEVVEERVAGPEVRGSGY